MADKRPVIGLDKVYVAALLTDDGTLAPTWSAPVALAGGVDIKTSPNGSLLTDWGDNGPMFVMNSRGNRTATLELIDVDPDVLALILGHTRANGITEEGVLDQSPYYALGFRRWFGGLDALGAKVYEYVWFPKGKFAVPEKNAETKKEKVSPQHLTLTAEFVKLAYNDKDMVHGRTDYSLSATAAANWFTAVMYSSSQSLVAVTLTSAAGSSAAHTITLTFDKGGASFSLIAPVDDNAVIVITDSTGVILTGTYTYTPSVAGVAPTLVIHNSNIAAVVYVVMVNTTLKDNNGVGVTHESILVTPA